MEPGLQLLKQALRNTLIAVADVQSQSGGSTLQGFWEAQLRFYGTASYYANLSLILRSIKQA